MREVPKPTRKIPPDCLTHSPLNGSRRRGKIVGFGMRRVPLVEQTRRVRRGEAARPETDRRVLRGRGRKHTNNCRGSQQHDMEGKPYENPIAACSPVGIQEDKGGNPLSPSLPRPKPAEGTQLLARLLRRAVRVILGRCNAVDVVRYAALPWIWV